MDKLKQILEVLRKHHFWILCGLAAIFGLAAWYMSTATLADQFKAGSDKINQYFTTLSSIPPEPKEEWMPAAETHIKSATDDVKGAWEALYAEQKKNLFIWPKSLGDDFIKGMESIEGTKNELDPPLRERYWDQVRKYVPALATIVDAEAPAIGVAPVAADQPPVEHSVSWPQLSEIQQGFEWDRSPSTQIIKQAQEELWVYEALAKIVAEVNNKKKGAHDAPIRQIISMDIAYSFGDVPLNGTRGRIPLLSGYSALGGADPTLAPPPPDASTPVRPDVKNRLHGDGQTTGATPTDGAPMDQDSMWRGFRYVNEKGEAMSSAEFDAAAPSAKFFLMPFRLIVNIDRRSIDRLLVECRNSQLPIEVKQVRINASATGSGGAMAPVIRTGGGSREHDDEGGRGGGGGPAFVPNDPNSAYNRYSTVELDGVVYLIQPPNLSAADSEQTPTADSTPTPPNGGAAAPATPR